MGDFGGRAIPLLAIELVVFSFVNQHRVLQLYSYIIYTRSPLLGERGGWHLINLEAYVLQHEMGLIIPWKGCFHTQSTSLPQIAHSRSTFYQVWCHLTLVIPISLKSGQTFLLEFPPLCCLVPSFGWDEFTQWLLTYWYSGQVSCICSHKILSYSFKYKLHSLSAHLHYMHHITIGFMILGVTFYIHPPHVSIIIWYIQYTIYKYSIVLLYTLSRKPDSVITI